jgi:hypothetical protein
VFVVKETIVEVASAPARYAGEGSFFALCGVRLLYRGWLVRESQKKSEQRVPNILKGSYEI